MNKEVNKNYELLLNNITYDSDVSKYWFDGIDLELEKFFSILTNKERMILRYRYGLDDYKIKSFDEVGHVFGMKESQIKNLEHLYLKKLRALFALSDREFVFNPYTLIDYAKELLEDQRELDYFYATSMPPAKSNSTKFFEKIIEVSNKEINNNQNKKRSIK